MRKGLILFKRLVALFLVLLFSINTFAAIVGDNDGAAFITKAEFDSMKIDFQSQLDRYNSSIDNKIDGAIASYLAGVRVKATEDLRLDNNANYRFPLVLFYNNDSWNDTHSVYFSLSRPRIRKISYETLVMPGNNADFDYIWHINDISNWSGARPFYGGNNNNPVFVCSLVDSTLDFDPLAGEVNAISPVSEQRNLGSKTFNVYDIKAVGQGYQYIDYDVSVTLSKLRNGGHFSYATGPGAGQNLYRYTTALGLRQPENTPANWSELRQTPSHFAASFSSDHNLWSAGPAADSDRVAATRDLYSWYTTVPLGTTRPWSNMEDWNTGTLTWVTGREVEWGSVNNATFIWQSSGRKLLFAGTSNMPAQVQEKYGLNPVWEDEGNTSVTLIAKNYSDFHNAIWLKKGTSALYINRWTAVSPIWSPSFEALLYDGHSSTVPDFCGLPAACARWFDENGDAHFSDEGMFLKKFTNLNTEAKVTFEVTFGTGSSTSENIDFYVSKKPFNRVNALNELYPFKLDNETNAVTSKTFATGTKHEVTVEDINNNDQLYILWKPTNGYDHYVQLDSFENFSIEK